jgi:hypothetical protein
MRSQRENMSIARSQSPQFACWSRRAGELFSEAMGEDTDTSGLAAPGALIFSRAGALGQLIEPIGGKFQQCTKVPVFPCLIRWSRSSMSLWASSRETFASSPHPAASSADIRPSLTCEGSAKSESPPTRNSSPSMIACSYRRKVQRLPSSPCLRASDPPLHHRK